MKDMNILPVKFAHNRPRCLYKGGRNIDEFFGVIKMHDLYRPEEWIGSVVESTTSISKNSEGLSHLLIGNDKILFKENKKYKNE